MSQDQSARWLICRICLKSDKKLYNIFEPIATDELADLGTTLLEKIELCGAITLNQEHSLPNKICNRCVLLLRAAYKFRDLCQQSQHQLRQFLTNMHPKLNSDETSEGIIDTDAVEQTTTVQEDLNNEQLVEADYVIEEYDDTSYEAEEPSLNDSHNDFITTIDVDGEEVHNFCNDESSQYVVEEVDAKGFNSEENDDEISTYRYESDPNGDHIIMEDQSKELKKQVPVKQTKERKRAVRRKRGHNQLDINGLYRCIFCNNSYKDKSKYNNHMKIHVSDKPHECEICNKRFSTTPQLSRHMNSHTGNRPYKCQYCEASFGDPSTKIKHERIHTNERPYKCCLCNKAFGYSNVLKVHMMTHTGEKPHTCSFCGKSFSQPHHKNAHEKRHTKVNMVIVQDSADAEYMDEDDLKEYKIEEII